MSAQMKSDSSQNKAPADGLAPVYAQYPIEVVAAKLFRQEIHKYADRAAE